MELVTTSSFKDESSVELSDELDLWQSESVRERGHSLLFDVGLGELLDTFLDEESIESFLDVSLGDGGVHEDKSFTVESEGRSTSDLTSVGELVDSSELLREAGTELGVDAWGSGGSGNKGENKNSVLEHFVVFLSLYYNFFNSQLFIGQ